MEIDILKEYRKAQEVKENINPNYVRDDLYLIHKYVMRLKERINEDTDLNMIIGEEFGQIIIDYLNLGRTDAMQIQENSMQILRSNPLILDKIYNKVKDKELTDKVIDKERYKIKKGEEQNLELEVELMLQELRKQNIDEKNKKSEKEVLEMYVPYRHKDLKASLLGLEKARLKVAGRFLKSYGFLQAELKMQNRDYKSLSLRDMQYKIRTEKGEDDIGLENIFEDEYLDSLSLEEITVLNAFWQNRFTKKIERN